MFTRIKDNPARAIVRLPRLGKIRLGVKKIAKNGAEYPAETDYFVCPPEVQAKFGEKPKSLLVMLPTENEELVVRQYYAVYGGNQKLLCQGDGESAERRIDGKIDKMACPGPKACEFAKDPKRPNKLRCGARTDLMVVLPTVNMGGVYQISTGSTSSDIDIRSGLAMAKHLYQRISWVPMEISREERKIADPVTGKMNPHWPVRLYPIGTIDQVNEGRRDTQRIVDVTAQYEVAAPQIEGPEVDTPVDFTDEENAPKDTIAETAKPEAHAPTPAQNQVMDMIAYIGEAESITALENIWKSLLPKISKLPGPGRVDVQTAHDRRATALRGK